MINDNNVIYENSVIVCGLVFGVAFWKISTIVSYEKKIKAYMGPLMITEKGRDFL